VPWRFLDAGRHSAWEGVVIPASKNLHTPGLVHRSNCVLFDYLVGNRKHAGQKPNRAGFLNAPNYQLSQWGLHLPATVRLANCSAFSSCISLIGSYVENGWIEQ
jgi:hypothetical protein